LILRRAPVDMVVLLGAPVEQSAVAALADLPLDLELEVRVLVLRHQIAGATILHDLAVGGVPANDGVGLETPPAVHGLAVEQWLPPALLGEEPHVSAVVVQRFRLVRAPDEARARNDGDRRLPHVSHQIAHPSRYSRVRY